jgi:glycogen debranching enzyme
METDLVSILDGSTFCVSDRRGDIDAGPSEPEGFFYRDMRHLSRWRLRLNDGALDVLSTDDIEYFAAQFFLVPPTGTIYTNPYLSVVRRRLVGDGFHEDLTVFNHGPERVELELRMEAGADFADLFEVKDALVKKGELYAEARDDALVLGYRREGFVRETRVTSGGDAEVDEHGFVFRVTIPPFATWADWLQVTPATDTAAVLKHGPGRLRAKPNMERSLEEWVAQAPALEADWDALGHTYQRSLVDLAALRFHPDARSKASVPAAGLPWFMTLFGRDSVLTSYQALPFQPELAATTLRVLAGAQGTAVDDFRDEEPGKILHELRFGELTAFKERPHSPYYGTADATPLFLVLLDEFERWSGDRQLVRALEPNARRALDWIDRFGDRDGDGYVEYERRNTETGLENQCWKDSWNSIISADGTVAKAPRATCEIQGYVYDARVRGARLAREVWGDADLAERLERQAADLKAAFNRDFWVADRAFFALALDADKRQVDSLTSNVGQLLWSGIVDDDKAEAVVRHLVSEQLFSGWGVRTMAEGQRGYNPIEYHNGTVWPHDNSLIAAGLARYGYRQEAARVAKAVLEAGTYFNYRLPEVFAGYPRELTSWPVEYPTASRPQAWATGAPLLLLRVLLGLEPAGERLATDPVLPADFGAVALRGIPGRWGRADAVAAGP